MNIWNEKSIYSSNISDKEFEKLLEKDLQDEREVVLKEFFAMDIAHVKKIETLLKLKNLTETIAVTVQQAEIGETTEEVFYENEFLEDIKFDHYSELADLMKVIVEELGAASEVFEEFIKKHHVKKTNEEF